MVTNGIDDAVARMIALRRQADVGIAQRDAARVLDVAGDLRTGSFDVDVTTLRRKVQVVAHRLAERLPHAADVAPMHRAFDQALAGLDELSHTARARADVEAMVARLASGQAPAASTPDVSLLDNPFTSQLDARLARFEAEKAARAAI